MIINGNASETNTMPKFISIGKENSINLSKNVRYGRYENTIRNVPLDNLFIHKYRNYLLSVCQEIVFTDEEYRKYKYRPKLLSYDIYGSVEYWMLLLCINNISNIADFNLRQIKYIPMEKIDIVELILNKESGQIKNFSNPEIIEII